MVCSIFIFQHRFQAIQIFPLINMKLLLLFSFFIITATVISVGTLIIFTVVITIILSLLSIIVLSYPLDRRILKTGAYID